MPGRGRRALPALLAWLALAPAARAQSTDRPPPPPPPAALPAPLGEAREVAVVPVVGGGQAVRVRLPAAVPDGALLLAELVEERRPPAVARTQAAARGGEAALLLRLPAGEAAGAAPGFYEVVVVHDPLDQPRWVKAARGAPGQRVLPVVVGTVEQAQAARDDAAAAAGAAFEALVAAAAELAQAFGPRAAPPARLGLQAWLRDRGVPRALALDAALAGLRPTRALGRSDERLRSLGARVRDALAARARAACLALEVALPPPFAGAGEPAEAGKEEALLIECLAARALARRDDLAPEPAPPTLDRVARRLFWLVHAGAQPPDLARPEVLAYALDDARLGLGRARRALVADPAPAAQALAARLLALEPALAKVEPAPPSLAAARAAWVEVDALLLACRDRVGLAHLAADRGELVALRERLDDAKADPAAAAAWRRRLGVLQALLVAAPAAARELARWLAAQADVVAAGKPVTDEARAAWAERLAALDAHLTR